MYLKELRIEGFKSFGKMATLTFPTNITGIVGPNGSGKSNVAEAFRFVLGEQSLKSMRGKRGEDLIFNGGTGAKRASKAAVSIIFDNTSRFLNTAFDEIAVSRTVYRNGSNEYTINGTQVRHRDVIELFARANIGSTGHHIISQGEADRVLHASNEKRKEILEDGLGLKLLQYRRAEAEKKLQKAQKNINETELLLREISPHLRHLKRQVDRHEKAKKIREDLEMLYAKYLAHETEYITFQKCTLEEGFNELQEKIKAKEKEIAREKQKTKAMEPMETFEKQENDLDEKIRAIQTEKDIVSRDIGRIEGEHDAIKTITEKSEKKDIQRKKIVDLHKQVQNQYKQTQSDNYTSLIKYILEQLRNILHDGENHNKKSTEKRIMKLQEEREKKWEKITQLKKEEEDLVCTAETLKKNKTKEILATRQSEKKLLEFITEKTNLDQKMAEIQYKIKILKEDEEHVRRELTEGTVLIGDMINKYKEIIIPPNAEHESREKQKERRHTLERKKIELESMGTGGSEEVYEEYREASERVSFLQKEKEDLIDSIKNCEEAIGAIKKEVSTRFESGVLAVSKEFGKFFKILFGGGSAGITIEKTIIKKEDGEPETRVGIAVQVSLPRKKITGIEQLSGGERALVSIALLFAISQITPPPFLILDETDAALDEANSKRYGDMVESLARKSQLILITHNRETMYRTGTLYGVTMSITGVSALLSVQFEDAVQVAK